ncbi:hypothetical protein [Microbacterium capsulatum]|uniref:Uncharacterized protein n=1 Tax=Microbacterium capsulatum TaxID=3041921 RepID=A0ABU0XF90_9MICO|nr:hypothetical protein [Microbacterium sp. ASV81]MDQ4213781.1 hypothetical protein [Microbacterium sp. ASV81]
MTEEMNDMRTPAGWTVSARVGIPGQDSPSQVPWGSGFAPQVFELQVATPEAETGTLMFSIVEGFPGLFAAWSSGLEVHDLLSKMKKAAPTSAASAMDWWKRKALYEIHFSQQEVVISTVSQFGTPDDLAALAAAGAQGQARILQTPVRRGRVKADEKEARLKDIAARYNAAVARGSKTPTKDVFEALGGGKTNRDLSYSRVAHLVTEARRTKPPLIR